MPATEAASGPAPGDQLAEMVRALPDEPRASRPTANPYPGLRAFDALDSAGFFGRQGPRNALRQRLSHHQLVFVLGGSGAGKSSLVRAGLLASLGGFAGVEGRAGRWYTATMRPRLDPAAELVEALLHDVCARFDPEANPRVGPAGWQALAAALDLDGAVPGPAGQARLRATLAELVTPGGLIAPLGLGYFVDHVLAAADAAVAGLARVTPGSANLMLVVDQFEEVFRPAIGTAAREALVELIIATSPAPGGGAAVSPALFITATMRSEELHNCTSHRRLTEAINRTFYLLPILGQEGVRDAILRPAQIALRQWQVPGAEELEGDAPFDPAVTARLSDAMLDLRGLRARPDDPARQDHAADATPLLQHALRRLWHQALSASVAAGATDAAGVVVTEAHLDAMLGNSLPGAGAVNPLVRCLNVHADAALERALKQSGASENEIKIAFGTLAWKDNIGRWVRGIAGFGVMCAAIGIDSQSVQARRVLEALGVLVEEGYLQRRELAGGEVEFEVAHEALIRNWNRARNWLEEQVALVADVERAADLLRDTALAPPPPPWQLQSPLGWARRLAQSLLLSEARGIDHQLKGSLAERVLQAQRRPFGRQWVALQLERPKRGTVAAVPDGAAVARVEALGAKAALAEKWQAQGALRRYGLIMTAVVVVVATLVIQLNQAELRRTTIAQEKRFTELMALAVSALPENGEPMQRGLHELDAVLRGLNGQATGGAPADDSALRVTQGIVDRMVRKVLVRPQVDFPEADPGARQPVARAEEAGWTQGDCWRNPTRLVAELPVGNPPGTALHVGFARFRDPADPARERWGWASFAGGKDGTPTRLDWAPDLELYGTDIACVSPLGSMLLLWGRQAQLPAVLPLRWPTPSRGSDGRFTLAGTAPPVATQLEATPSLVQLAPQQAGAAMERVNPWRPRTEQPPPADDRQVPFGDALEGPDLVVFRLKGLQVEVPVGLAAQQIWGADPPKGRIDCQPAPQASSCEVGQGRQRLVVRWQQAASGSSDQIEFTVLVPRRAGAATRAAAPAPAEQRLTSFSAHRSAAGTPEVTWMHLEDGVLRIGRAEGAELRFRFSPAYFQQAIARYRKPDSNHAPSEICQMIDVCRAQAPASAAVRKAAETSP